MLHKWLHGFRELGRMSGGENHTGGLGCRAGLMLPERSQPQQPHGRVRIDHHAVPGPCAADALSRLAVGPRRSVDLSTHGFDLAAEEPAQALSRLLGSPTSMALDIVATEGRARKSPVARYSGTTSLVFVEATKRSTGTPIRAAMMPAVRLPKFPEGTEKVSDAGKRGCDAHACT